jgi:hypothetical protein
MARRSSRSENANEFHVLKSPHDERPFIGARRFGAQCVHDDRPCATSSWRQQRTPGFELASTKEQGPPSSMKPNAPSTPHSQIPTGALPVLVDGEHAHCGVEGESSEVNRCRRRGELAGRWCCHARGGENRRDERSRGKRDEIFHLNPHYTAGTRGASCEPAAPRAPGRQAPDSRARGNSSSS